VNRPLRVGVLGAGAWAIANHIPALARRSDVELVAVNRLEGDSLRRIKDRFGFAYASTDYRQVLDHNLDVVLVTSPAAFHHELALAAIESGAHVLVEKPFTITPADAWELVRAAERSERHIVLAFGWHYRPIVMAAKDLMEDGAGFGEIEYVSISMSSPTRGVLVGDIPQFAQGTPSGGGIVSHDDPPDPDLRSQLPTMTDPAVAGGGYAQAQLSHAIGLGLWLSDLRGASVYALMRRPSVEAVEYHDALTVSFTNGAIGTVSGGSSHDGANADKHALVVRIIGDRGELFLDLGRSALWQVRSGEGETRFPVEPDAGDYTCDGPVNALCDLALGLTRRNASPGELGARTVEILAAAYESDRRSGPVSISPTPQGYERVEQTRTSI
jgi:predicted dehydrogenase